jgi:hypothetical protein
LTAIDRVLWVWLSHQWRGWRSAVHIVQPATVLAFHDASFDVIDLDHGRVSVATQHTGASDRLGEEMCPVVRLRVQRPDAVGGGVHMLADDGMDHG